MSFSRGGKVRYQTPCCHVIAHHARIFHQESYFCPRCQQCGPWRARIRISMKKHPLHVSWWSTHHFTALMTTKRLRFLLPQLDELQDRAGLRPTGKVVRRTFRLFLSSTWFVTKEDATRIVAAWCRCSNYWKAYNGSGDLPPALWKS